MRLKRIPLILLLSLIMVLTVGGLTVYAGTNLPNVVSYGVYNFDPNSNDVTTTVPQGTVVSTGNDGVIYNNPPWTTLTDVPYVFGNNVGIGIEFAVNVIPEAYWTANQACFHMYDASNTPVPINVIRLGTVYDGTNGNRNYIFVVPQGQLQPVSTYKIIIDSTLQSNNTMTAGKQQEITLSTAAAPDTTAPSVSSSDPANAATGVAINKTVALTFSENISAGSTYDQISFKDGSNADVLFTKGISGSTLTLDPVSDLDYCTYTVTIPADAVKDAANNDLANEYSLTFSTGLSATISRSRATAGASFTINITGAKDASDTLLTGNNTVTVTNGGAEVYRGDVAFTDGAANVTIPASSTPNSITTVGTYNLTVAIAGVTEQPTVPLTINAGSIDSTQSTAVIDQALSKGTTRAIAVTLKDIFGNPIANKNIKTKVTIANNYSITNESYTVDGTTMTASGFTTAVYTDVSGQYTVNVVMPGAIDPGDGVSIQIAQNNGTSFIGDPFAYYEPIPTPMVTNATSDATHIVLTMDQPLLGTAADTNAFTIHGAASNPTVANAVVSGTNVSLTLNAAIAYNETITLDYARTGINDLNNGPGSQVADFTSQPVINNTPEHAAAPLLVSAASNVQGNVITVIFDKEMAALPAAPAGFSVAVDGASDVVTEVANNTDRAKVELLLTTAINYGQTVTISYSPGTVTALDNGALAGFTDQAVTNNTIQDGYITTLLGDGSSGNSGDNGPATSATMARTIYGCTVVDEMGNIYISDSSNGKVREIAAITHTQFGINMTAGNIYTVAGTGLTRSYAVTDEGQLATAVNLMNSANGIAVDDSGNLYIADTQNSRIREVANTDHNQYGITMTTGCIYTIAGVGATGLTSNTYTTAIAEEGVAATTAHLCNPNALIFDTTGNLYIVDQNNNRIRKMDTSGIINTVAGTGTTNPTADSGPAISFNMRPAAITFDSLGNIFIGDGICGRIYKMDTGGNITTYAGTLIPSGSSYTIKDVGSAPPLTEVGFRPVSLMFDSADNLYVAEGNWDRVRKIGIDGSVTLAAGYGYAAGVANVFNGDNIPATAALLNSAQFASLDKWGNMYIMDNQSMRIRFVKNPQVVAEAPPVVNSAVTSDETHIVLTMSRALLGTAVNPAAFTVSGAASNPTVTAAAVSGTSVTLTLSSAIAYNDTITVSYAKTGFDSAAGYSNLTAVENFTNQPVTVTVPAPGTVAVPTAVPSGTAVTAGTQVTLTTMTAGATIYYSLDGSDPTAASTAYNGPITINNPVTIKAIAVKDGMINSTILTVSYTIKSGNGGPSSLPTWPDDATLTVSKNQTTATLTWTEATGEVTKYRIYRGVSGIADTLIATIDAPATTYTDTTLQSGGYTYIFKVEAGNNAGWTNSGPSAQTEGGQNPLILDGAYLTTATPSSSTSDTGESVDDSTSVPVKPTIKFIFERSVAQDELWSNNKLCFTMKDSSGASVSLNVFKISNGTEINPNERHNLFITPLSNLTAGNTYYITISKNLQANNGKTLGEAYDGKDIVISFTVAGGTNSGGGTVTTDGPTYTNGYGSVDPAVGASVALDEAAMVVIPPDALKETGSVNVNIKKVTTSPAVPAGFKVAGDVYEFSVGNKTSYSFAKSVALTFNFDASQIEADEVPEIYYYDEVLKKWVGIGGTVSGSTITVQVNHFTKFAVLAVPKAVEPVKPVVPVVSFTDVNGNWAAANITKLAATGAIKGYTDGTFKPDNNITRAEFVTVLVKALKLAPASGKTFNDTANSWSKDYIATAVANGIINGYSDTTFGPDDPITREQMAVIIVKADKLSKIPSGKIFADNGAISAWAKDAVSTASGNSIIAGYADNTFRPQNYASRAEAVTVIVKILK
ncbi:MAG: S-layer homology domain-containing protein [Syntrophomonas sp.]